MASAKDLIVGLDIGSTTVKSVVVEVETQKIIWSDYQRHDTKQPEKCLEFLQRMEADTGIRAGETRMFLTGSGGGGIATLIGAKFVQEVNAVSLAVEHLYPECGSVVELGGQDAKIIIFKEDPETGRKKKLPSMNDKCAGGTGAVIDKINAKLRIPAEELCNMGYLGMKLHPVAGKCGVFAETDINGLQKSGVPPNELMASLFEAIIQQNLAVLTRGNTLRPVVLLLGGPNTYIKGMRDCWKSNIPKVWEERNFPLPEGKDPEDLVQVPENAQYFAAIGCVRFGMDEDANVGIYQGSEKLEWYMTVGRQEEKKKKGSAGLYKTDDELDAFKGRYKPKEFVPHTFQPGEQVRAFMGIDGGSTSTKAVLLNEQGEVTVKCYQLSKGNPLEDTKEMFANLRQQVESQGATLELLGVGSTGYAKDILKDVLNADVAIVETVAHTEAALHFYPQADVICDVGGQDIKLIILQDGRVKDFKLNTQCSAGNGYFLQSTCVGFGFDVKEYADIAFGAKAMPMFGYGCAVFMQSDIVDFQRQGWKPEEIMAGLANVLPKNIWLYVSQIPNLASLGNTFVLQGGTQHNLAAVKSQVDFIESRFKDKGAKPNVIVHEHCGESGAIGAALEARRLYNRGQKTQFIGLDAVDQITYVTHRSENTRCYFCKNKCMRTFIDVSIADADESWKKSKIPIPVGIKRLIVGNSCEKGLVEDVNDMREIKKGLDAMKKENPNLTEVAAKAAFKSYAPPVVADPLPKYAFTAKQKKRVELMKKRKDVRIGIARILNQYSVNPIFSAYFEALGIPAENVIYSDYTSEQLYKEGAKRGAIDPCFPSKVGIPHVHNLLYVHHKKKPLDIIFCPMIDDLPSDLPYAQSHRACPTVTTTPESVKAAFIKEGDIFKENNLVFLNTFVNPANETLLAKQLYDEFKDILGLSWDENFRAVKEGLKAQEQFQNGILRAQGREILKKLEAEGRIGIVVLGRPYHNDPGINHEILEEFQKIGYPVLTQASLPIDDEIVWRLFGDDVKSGAIRHPMDISDAWKNSYSENTSQKIWAAKYTARHPNLVALELSSFKCGHDAPIYTAVEETVTKSGTPYFSFKDIDENKPAGSIKIRVETIGYFLKRYREDMVYRKQKQAEIDSKLKELEAQLRAEFDAVPSRLLPGPPPPAYEVETPVGINAIRREE
ncbi:MAG: acyl-CoA dehydratase activase-related protein [Acidobacteriia bacterium]|nr:acyl-CoA dehydratase activase-related protein [Terriglobia bacterium]